MQLPTGLDLLYILIFATVIVVFLAIYVTKWLSKQKGVVQFGKFQVNGLSISNYISKIVKLEIEIIKFEEAKKKEQRSIVNEEVEFAISKMKEYSREYISDKLCCGDTEITEIKLYNAIADGVIFQTVKRLMESVDRNHYADKSDSEWKELKVNLFSRVFKAIETYFIDRYDSSNVPLKEISDRTKSRQQEYYQIFDNCLDRCRKISYEIKENIIEKRKEIETISIQSEEKK